MRRLGVFLTGLSFSMLAGLTVGSQSAVAGQPVYLEKGQPEVILHPTVEQARFHAAHGHGGGGSGGGSVNLLYGGGVGGIGVESAPKVYLVIWGSQWVGNDPSGEANLLNSFLSDVGGSSWFNSVTQYCQGVATGTTFCNGQGTAAGNPAGMYQGIWYDTGSATPNRPSQSNIAAEAVRAAAHFGNTAAGSNNNTQYVIALPTGVSPQGFKTSYCAYHSYSSSSYGNVAYTNLPYITDAGSSCGANFNGMGPLAGITMVEGHELGETVTDQFPSGGWTDSSGAENGDKCAWISSGQGASAIEQIGSGSYPVQSLWSNAFNSGAGGCVMSY
ncbi:MAG TPA: hypothetical protein VF117_05145 [Gammaproteobacteria bacterium]